MSNLAVPRPGVLYRPANNTEATEFLEQFCICCKRGVKYMETKDRKDGCSIMWAALSRNVEDPRYPREWRYDADVKPTCTAFERDAKSAFVEFLCALAEADMEKAAKDDLASEGGTAGEGAL